MAFCNTAVVTHVCVGGLWLVIRMCVVLDSVYACCDLCVVPASLGQSWFFPCGDSP